MRNTNRTPFRSLGAAVLLSAAGGTLAPASAAGQLVTDRPDFTESTATVPSGGVQLEAGYTFSRVGSADTHQIGEALLRIGMIPGLELRVGVPSYFATSRPRTLLDDHDASGFGDAHLGMKLGLYEAGLAEGLPSLALLLGTGVPTGDDDLAESAGGWEPEAKIALGWSFTDRVGLGANVNYAQRDSGFGERYDEWGASIALGFPLTQRLSGFGEYFAIRPDFGDTDLGDSDYIDGGVTWLLSPDFQLDARVGVAIDKPSDADDWFFGVGFARLF